MRRNQGAPNLRRVIEVYEGLFDQRELQLLSRLTDSASVAKAFERLTRHRSDREYVYISILRACTEAEQLARTFPKQLRNAKQTIKRMERLEKMVAELRKLVGEPPKRKGLAEMAYGLDLIADRIANKRCNAKEAIASLGATRKVQSKKAAQLSAIWFLGNHVRRTTGKPHLTAVADLAQVILGSVVSLDRVRHAMRSRRTRQFDEMVVAQTERAADMDKIAEVRRRQFERPR